jgi:hypothetical protein
MSVFGARTGYAAARMLKPVLKGDTNGQMSEEMI